MQLNSYNFYMNTIAYKDLKQSTILQDASYNKFEWTGQDNSQS